MLMTNTMESLLNKCFLQHLVYMCRWHNYPLIASVCCHLGSQIFQTCEYIEGGLCNVYSC